MFHSKILTLISERDEFCILQGEVQIDMAYSGKERADSKAGHSSENKVAIVASNSLNAAGHPIHTKVPPVTVFTSGTLADWGRQHLSSSCSVLSDGLACFRLVVSAGCSQTALVHGGPHPKCIPQFRWSNILLGNLQTRYSGSFYSCNFDKYVKRDLSGFCFLFKRRF